MRLNEGCMKIKILGRLICTRAYKVQFMKELVIAISYECHFITKTCSKKYAEKQKVQGEALCTQHNAALQLRICS